MPARKAKHDAKKGIKSDIKKGNKGKVKKITESEPEPEPEPEPIDIYIAEYWFNGKCIKVYQQDPIVTDIEITVHDYIRNYDDLVASGERVHDHLYELKEELENVDTLLTKVNDKRKKNMKSNIFIAGDNLINELEKVDEGGFSNDEDLDPDEIWARGENNNQQLWFSHIRTLLHAGMLRNDFDNGVGYRLIHSTVHPQDPEFEYVIGSTHEI